MKRIIWIGAAAAALIIILAYLFGPLDFYINSYSNRYLSENPLPPEAREGDVFTEYDWELTTFDGRLYPISEAEGKVMLINFWATWCPPCVAEMPDLQELYRDYGSEVEFLFVARDRESRVKRFIEKKGYEIPVYYEKGLTPKILYNLALPTTFIIDSKGQLIEAYAGERDWNSPEVQALLDRLLEER